MIALIILAALELIVIITLVNKNSKLHLENTIIQDAAEFSNVSVQRAYSSLATFLKTRKSKLSLESKVYVLDGWYSILLGLPKEVESFVVIQPDSLDFKNDTMSLTEHKKAVIEALEKLADLDHLEFSDYKLFATVSYHLMFLCL